MLLDVDLGLGELTWEEIDEEEDESAATPEDADFTSQPQGVDLQPVEPIDAPELSPITVEEFRGAAEVIEVCKNRFAQLWEGDRLYGLRKIAGSHYPFSGTVEFMGVESFLQYLPMGRINDFLKLDYVRQTLVLCITCTADRALGRSGKDPSPFHLHKSYEHVSKPFLALLLGKK